MACTHELALLLGTAALRRRVILSRRNRVHPVDVPFTQAIKTVSRWGSGSKDLVAAMEKMDPA
jgi:hypothetical protein